MVVLTVCSVCWRYSVRGKEIEDHQSGVIPPGPHLIGGVEPVPCDDMFLFFLLEMMLVLITS